MMGGGGGADGARGEKKNREDLGKVFFFHPSGVRGCCSDAGMPGELNKEGGKFFRLAVKVSAP